MRELFMHMPQFSHLVVVVGGCCRLSLGGMLAAGRKWKWE
jgi:hypothetical protein